MFDFTETDAREMLAYYDIDIHNCDDAAHGIAHELADASEWVIFPAQARRLVCAATAEEVARADDSNRDCAMIDADTTFDRHVQLVAYWIVYYRAYFMLERVLVETADALP